MSKPRYDQEDNKSRHAAVDPDCCEEMAQKYSWRLVDIEPLAGDILKVDCVFEGETEFPDWYKEQERRKN
ncbi:hypothetical protein [Spirulina sp. 06S082]|uniref:hypothetical protein n=1 Tax=Spirulina sp. 06S082 TaxID=3110248 RepID=UPI002B215846|nr:hypothetical protein [Spirulina sp. 06S082]MEA5471494.1 hypothetical protein [Spirulina sp. 06S082]